MLGDVRLVADEGRSAQEVALGDPAAGSPVRGRHDLPPLRLNSDEGDEVAVPASDEHA